MFSYPSGSRAVPSWVKAPGCWAWGITGCSLLPCARRSRWRCSMYSQDPLRQPLARLGGRSTRGGRVGHQCEYGVLAPSQSFRSGRPGGALGAEVLGLDPSFPLKFMIYFLIVVAVGGTSSITGPLLRPAAGIADVAGKYYIPRWVVSSYTPDDRDSGLAPARPVCAPGGKVMTDPQNFCSRVAAGRSGSTRCVAGAGLTLPSVQPCADHQ